MDNIVNITGNTYWHAKDLIADNAGKGVIHKVEDSLHIYETDDIIGEMMRVSRDWMWESSREGSYHD